MREDTMHPHDCLPEVWSGIVSLEEWKQHYQRRSMDRLSKIQFAESQHKRNGLIILRCDDDLREQLHNELPVRSNIQDGCVLAAGDRLVAATAFERKDVSAVSLLGGTIATTTLPAIAASSAAGLGPASELHLAECDSESEAGGSTA